MTGEEEGCVRYCKQRAAFGKSLTAMTDEEMCMLEDRRDILRRVKRLERGFARKEKASSM